MFKELISKKKSKSAIILGCGPSINDVSEEDWDIIASMDKWTLNNWMIHKVVPDFYHLEVKKHRNGPLIRKIIDIKKNEYCEVNWILDATRDYLLDYVDPKLFKNIYRYNKRLIESSGTHDILKNCVTCILNPRSSLSIVFDIISRFNYDKIYICGIDLYDSTYFWTNNNDYNEYDIPAIMNTCKPDERDPKDNHPTYKIAEFIKVFCDHNNINVINLSERSLLSKVIGTHKLEK